MKLPNLSRRRLLKLISISSALSAMRTNKAFARADDDGKEQLSQRSVVNMNFLSSHFYAFINHYVEGAGSTSMVGRTYSTTSKTWGQIIGADGWPHDPAATETFGGSIQIPGTDQFAGPYVITWDGDGRVNLDTGTWTVDTTPGVSLNFEQNANGRWQNKKGRKPRIVARMSGLKGPQHVGVQIHVTNLYSTGSYLRNLQIYRLEDEADLLAGKIFRRGFKQPLVDLNPSAIRFMNWCAGGNSLPCRFENRTLPNTTGYVGGCDWVTSPAYGEATGTNQYILAAAEPTAGNRKTTPARDFNGEVVTCRVANPSVRCGRSGGLGAPVIASITNASNATVTTRSAHGFATGDKIIHRLVGMKRLHYFPVTITVLNATQYTIGVDTTDWGKFESGTAFQFVSLSVGGRRAYHVVDQDGYEPSGLYDGVADHDLSRSHFYQSFFFDKSSAAETDGNGNWIYGVWLYERGGNSGHVPVEICTALINEINEMSVAQGVNNPVHMWLCLPVRALTVVDPDYTPESDWGLGVTGVALNGTKGYAGLTKNAKLFMEFGNEVWNFLYPHAYVCRRQNLRWPGTSPNNACDMQAFLSSTIMRSIKAAYPNSSNRIVGVLGGWAFVGVNPGGFGANYELIHGNSTPGGPGYAYTTDAYVIANGYGMPMNNHDAFAIATYFDPPNAYYSTKKGRGTFTDDSAMFNGTDNSSNGGGNYSGHADQSQAIANFVAKCVTPAPAEQSTYSYVDLNGTGLLRKFADTVRALGKTVIGYEGGTDWETAAGGRQGIAGSEHVLTAADAAFSVAVINSPQWAAAQIDYFNRAARVPGAAMPSVYNHIGYGTHRWSYKYPNAYSGTVEGLSDNPTWVAMGNRNRALST
jgi:hypothetical protein